MKKALVGLLTCIVTMVLLGFLLPREVRVQRSIQIAAPKGDVWGHVADFRAFNAWSPWADIDPSTRYSYSGQPGAVGAKMVWASAHPNVGKGSQEITLAEAPNRLVTALDFGADGVAEASFALTESGGQTTVTWSMVTDMGAGPVGRWLGLLMDRMIGGDYERGLVRLQSAAESGPWRGDRPVALPGAATAASLTEQ